jgi:hypothetical protein
MVYWLRACTDNTPPDKQCQDFIDRGQFILLTPSPVNTGATSSADIVLVQVAKL